MFEDLSIDSVQDLVIINKDHPIVWFVRMN